MHLTDSRFGGLAALVLLLAPAPSGNPRDYRGKPATLARKPTSQVLAFASGKAVAGDTLEVGGGEFSVQVEDSHVRIARLANGRMDTTVKSGKVVKLLWKAGADRHEQPIRFERSLDGAWSCFPAQCVRYEIAGQPMALVDGNLDGNYVVGQDGFLIADQLLLRPLNAELVLGRNLIRIDSLAANGLSMSASVTAMDGTESQLAALERLNSLRARNGLPEVRLDPDLSSACSAHAEYLKAHHWDGLTNPHSQSLGPEGSTVEGIRAAQRSVISACLPEAAIRSFWKTWYHRIDLAKPGLSRVGINATAGELAVVDVGQAHAEEQAATWIWADPVCIPADGSVGQGTHASPEFPVDPVSNMGSRGTPLQLIFHDWSPDVADFSGSLVELQGNSTKEVSVIIADRGRHLECFGLVPSRPLKPGTCYRATFRYARNGRQEIRTIDFMTE